MGPSLFSDGRETKLLPQDLASHRLQWGRRCSATEGQSRGVPESRVPSASMGPSLFSDGRRDDFGLLHFLSPRFNGAVAVQRRKGWFLCGLGNRRRRFNGAVAVQRRKGLSGRAPVPRSPRFNGAVAVQRRKGLSRGARRELLTSASMGPSLFSDGRQFWEAHLSAVPLASMGPSLFSDGRNDGGRKEAGYKGSFNGAVAVQRRKENRGGVSPVIPSSGFNGAVAVQRRKGCTQSGSAGSAGPLQWGRRCSATEGFLSCVVNYDSVVLQWGRRCSATEGPDRELTRSKLQGFNGAVAVQRRKGTTSPPTAICVW